MGHLSDLKTVQSSTLYWWVPSKKKVPPDSARFLQKFFINNFESLSFSADSSPSIVSGDERSLSL